MAPFPPRPSPNDLLAERGAGSTEPKPKPEPLAEAERRARELQVTLSSIGDAVVSTDSAGAINFLNPAAEKLMGWTSEEAQGRPLSEVFRIFHETDGSSVDNPVTRVLRERVVVSLANHTVLRRRDGLDVPIEDSAAPIFDHLGVLTGVILVFHDVTEKRERARRLEESERRLRSVFNQQFQFMALLSPDGHVLEVNGLALASGGLSREEVVGKLFWETRWWDDLPEMRAGWPRRLGAAAQSSGAILSEDLYRAGDGELRIADAAITAVRDANGELDFFIVQASDITERKRAEAALRESEARAHFLNELAEATRTLADPAAIMTTSARLLGTHLRASRCAYADVAEDSEHFEILDDYTDRCGSSVGAYQLSLFGPKARSDMREGRTLVLSDVEAELLPAEGGATFGSIQVRAIVCCPLVKETRLHAMMAVHQTTPRIWTAAEIKLVEEVVERCWAYIENVRTSAALRESEERHRTLADNIPQLAWIANADGWISWYSQRWFEYTGTTLKEMQGWGWKNVHDPAHVDRVIERFQDHLQTGEVWEDTFPIRGKDGDYRWFLSRAMPIRDASGKVQRWFGTNTDITEQRELAQALAAAKEQAEAASHAKDNFLAALSHELRTPLTPVLMTAAALRDDDRLPDDVREQLAVVQRNVELEARLIDDLLDLTRIARGQLSLRPQMCDAHSLIGLAAEIVRDEAERKGQEVTFDLAARHSGLLADPARLQQLFWNLIRNAVKFTRPGGRVAVRTRDTEAGLRIEISDTGIGIGPASLERIFLPFEQAGLTNDHRFGGLGLGLSIARAIADLHGGTILAASPGPEQGATFTVDLPNASEPPERVVFGHKKAGASLVRGSAAEATPPLRLLVVEDHAPTLQVLERLLTRAGHRVVSAATAAAALEAARNHPCDAVVSDLGLPDGTGFELMETLRATYQLPGIALSGFGMEEDIARSKAAGFSAHLVKPVDFKQLQTALHELSKGLTPRGTS